MKKILFLSFYFEPDLCAGSFRNSPLAKVLAKKLNGKAIVDVITTMPNRYSSFSINAPINEQFENLTIRRIILPSHKSGFFDQIKAFYKYYQVARKETMHCKYDLVFASSSRLFTAYLGYKIANKRKIPLYLDIRDIFVDTLNDVIANSAIKLLLLPVLRKIEFKVFNYASHINLISEGFSEYFAKYYRPKYTFFTNGIDDEFIQSSTYEDLLPYSPIIITYAGNIGEGQGLHKLIPKAAKLLGNQYQFRVIGDGGAKSLLLEEIKKESVENVSIEKPVKRKELLEIYKRSHYLLLHLNEYPAFEKVLPSKVFELGAFPRPIIAGVNGYAKIFIEKNLEDALLFNPTKYEELVKKINLFDYKILVREEFIKNFSRGSINEAMAESIVTYIK